MRNYVTDIWSSNKAFQNTPYSYFWWSFYFFCLQHISIRAQSIELSCITRHLVNQIVINLRKMFVEINVLDKTAQFGLELSAVDCPPRPQTLFVQVWEFQ